ncbi:MFS transporter [Subtercola endophyticus]|uniref:MFS transporter n=1 Tax=Subtercola endophyticus TaxID=2895559 RepID=UPI001E48E30D|nr:MFS transporter [Subtercola endophyticus]UFS58769.1 MFS transporter [Subtercola endophyticus]
MSELAADQGWTRRLLVLSITAAVAVSVIYLPQSLLTNLAANLGVPTSLASVVATTVQVGYALGILLLVPLADRVHPRRQVTVQSIILAAALVASALMPEVVSVAIGFLIVGLVANIAQVIIPAAGRLSPASRKGATTGTLVGALLIGIFGGRIVASLLVGAIGWRWVIIIFAALVLVMLPFARRALDAPLPLEGAPRSYGRLLLSTLALARRSPTLVQSAIMQFFVFATFNSIWTVMVLHLTAAPFGWSVLAAGLFGLVGLAAGIVTPFSGRFIDRFGALPVAGGFLALMLVSVVLTIFDSSNIIFFAITVFFATWANQSIQSANQSRVLQTNPGASAQANTLFMFFVFLGGSVGALLGPIAFAAGGMTRVAEQGTVFVLIAALTWMITTLVSRRGARTSQEPMNGQNKKGATA